MALTPRSHSSSPSPQVPFPFPQSRLEPSRTVPPRAAVLVLDPDPGTQRLLRILLEPHYAVRIAGTVIEAQAYLRQQPADVVIASMELPGVLHGPKVLEMLRVSDEAGAPPVIGLTSTGWRKERARFLDQGLAECLFKPFRVNDLRAAVRQVLAGPPIRPS